MNIVEIMYPGTVAGLTGIVLYIAAVGTALPITRSHGNSYAGFYF
jgi:hypothetical protein